MLKDGASVNATVSLDIRQNEDRMCPENVEVSLITSYKKYESRYLLEQWCILDY